MSARPLHRAARRGFTLIEIVVVIAIISIMAAMAAPLAGQVLDQQRITATRKKMLDIQTAFTGDPALGTGGFVSDIGRLPNNLGELTSGAGLPAPTTTPLGVHLGWWGPYINPGFDGVSYQRDGWNNQIQYATAGPLKGQLVSPGPSLAVATDDISLPFNTGVVTQGTLTVHLMVWDAPTGKYLPDPVAGVALTETFYYAQNGGQQTLTCAPAGGACSFTQHSGNHAVRVTGTYNGVTASGDAVAVIVGNQQSAVTITVH
jgi:general secretion pathway protein G